MTVRPGKEECSCSDAYECPHRCWHCGADRTDGCEEWCHIRPFEDGTTRGTDSPERSTAAHRNDEN